MQTSNKNFTASFGEEVLNVASFWPRVFARVIDGVFISIILTAIYLPLSYASDRQDLYLIVLGIGWFCRWLLYVPIMDALGGTLGKRICGLRVLSYNGLRPTLFQCYKKASLLLIPFLFGLPIGLLFSILSDNPGAMFGYLNFTGFLQLLWIVSIPLVKEGNGNRTHDDYAGLMVVRRSQSN